MTVRRALISVYDKAGLTDFARALSELGVDLISSGGTYRALADDGIAARPVESVTGFPEMLDGRVKTLHPALHGGILARRDAQHLRQLEAQGIGPIDLVAVNLYPFAATVAREAVTFEEAIEHIDIGGPSLIRGAAKNHAWVTVVTSPEDYGEVINELHAQGDTSPRTRRRLALKAFQHTASYDTQVAAYLRALEGPDLPEELTLALIKAQDLRYGENPGQDAAFYRWQPDPRSPVPSGIASSRHLHGAEMSYNAYLDADAAVSVAYSFSEPAAVIVKHINPCGLAVGIDVVDCYRRALSGDPIAAFGGIVGLNRPVNAELAAEIRRTHFDTIVAPAYEEEALAVLLRRSARLLALGTPPRSGAPELRSVSGGVLLQTGDVMEEAAGYRVVTRRQPTPAEMDDLRFAWVAARHVKSNAIVLASERTLVGVGAGQMSRVDSVDLAVQKAGARAQGSALASDAFFPFPDGVEHAAAAGVRAVIQPGGSKKDEEVIAAANEHGLAMVFTGRRHFRH